MPKSVCFTGHRPRKFISNDSQKHLIFKADFYTQFKNQLNDFLNGLVENGYDIFITGGAQGFDQLVFWEIDKLKIIHNNIINIVYIPFEGQEARWNDYGIFGKEKYNQMLEKADRVVICSDCNMYSSSKELTNAMFIRNHRMVDDSELLVACITEEEYLSNIKGGTAETIHYALNHNKDIIKLCTKIRNNKLIIV